MKFNIKKASYGIVLILFIILCTQLDFRHLYHHLRSTPIELLALLVILQVVTQTTIAYQYSRLSKRLGEKISILKMIYINSVGTVIEAITPGVKVGGEAVKVYKIKEETNMSIEKSTVLVLAQKTFSMSAFIILSTLSLLYINSSVLFAEVMFIKSAIFIVLIGILVAVVAGLILHDKFIKYLEKNNIKGTLKEKAYKLLKNFEKAVYEIKGDRKEIILQILIAFGVWILYPLKLYLILTMFDVSLGFLGITAITFIAYFAGMIPIFPGGLLGFELTMTTLLVPTGLEIDHIVFVTSLFRFITFWLVVGASAVIIGCVNVKRKMSARKKSDENLITVNNAH